MSSVKLARRERHIVEENAVTCDHHHFSDCADRVVEVMEHVEASDHIVGFWPRVPLLEVDFEEFGLVLQ